MSISKKNLTVTINTNLLVSLSLSLSFSVVLFFRLFWLYLTECLIIDLLSLVGVLVHTGNAENGHYYSFIKERSKKSDILSHSGEFSSNSRNLGQWFCFNDRVVKPFNPELIPEECFGGITHLH
jgi:hypothetical protein